jgi:hypothetical protein
MTRALSGDRGALNSMFRGAAGSGAQPSPLTATQPGSLPLGAQANAWRSQMLRAQSRVQADRNGSGAFNAQTPGTIVRPAPGMTTPTPVRTRHRQRPDATPTPSSDGSKTLGRAAQRWIQSSQEEFARGEFEGAQVTNTGTIQIAPTGKLLATTTEPFAWSIAADGRGNTYLGTGNEARIIRIDASGTTSTLYDGREVAVTALTTDAAGNLYAGVSPGGRILRFTPAASAAPFSIPARLSCGRWNSMRRVACSSAPVASAARFTASPSRPKPVRSLKARQHQLQPSRWRA